MKKYKQFFLPALAVVCCTFATLHIVQGHEKPEPLPPPIDPARSPFGSMVAGSGMVESQTENISIGSHLPGVVDRVFVTVGTPIGRGKPLFQLDTRQHEAELKVRKANLMAAQAQLDRLSNMPRAEELPPVEARHRETTEAVAQQEDLFNRAKSMFERRVISKEDLVQKQQAFRMVKEQAAKAEADYKLMKAGAWEQDKAVAKAAVAQAEALLAQTQTELERLIVKSPVDGEVLQVNVRPGEFVAAPAAQTLLIIGNVNRLHVRVDIDEHDIPRFKTTGKAQASMRGDATQKFNLRLVRVEPFVIPKKSLSGDSAERVDTRVLQVIYAVEEKSESLHVGQQVDVYVETEGKSTTESAEFARLSN